MTDHRAEQAFRDAFARETDRLDTAPIPVVRRRRRRWPVALGAAAAVLVLVAGTAVAVTVAGDDDPGDRTATRRVGALPAAQDGWRWATWRDVGVQVPVSWADGAEWGSDWCADVGPEPAPVAPYVARENLGRITMDILCTPGDPAPPTAFGPAPIRLMSSHLTFATPGKEPDGETTFQGWTATLRTVGSVQVRLYTDAATADLVDRVLGSLRTFTTDDLGCDVTSPVQVHEFVRPAKPFDVTTIEDVDGISICQYDRGLGDTAVALKGSRRLEGPAAADLLADFQAAPAGGGPDRPQNCLPELTGDEALVVRLDHDGRTDALHVYYDGCRHNGVDDGTTLRALTRESCAPLFERPIMWSTVQSAVARRCGQR